MNLSSFLTDFPGAPGTPVLHWPEGVRTLEDLTSGAAALARLLGPVTRRPVACLVDGGPLAVTAMFATWRAGGVYVPVNARLPDPEIAGQLGALAPAAVVVGGRQAERLPDGPHRLVVGAGGDRGDGSAGWAVSGPEPPQDADLFGPGAALVMRTSGTTGAARPVVLDHEGVGSGIDTVIRSLRGTGRGSAGRPMPNLVPTSLALWAGVWNTLFALRLGAEVVLLDPFEPARYAALVQRFGIRSTILAPPMMTMLCDDPAITGLGPLRYVRSVTAPLSPAQARRFHDRFGVGVLNSYGQTELGGEVAGWTAADLRAHGTGKLGAVGRPHPGVRIRIVDEEGRGLPAGAVGEIWIGSPFATFEAAGPGEHPADGFRRTGDLGRLDDDGFLWIEGRVSDTINRGGLKVVPHEVEEVLREHPDVADACVAGVPDARLGEVPVAWVRPATGRTPDPGEIRAFARGRLGGYKVPVEVHRVDEFPRTEIGKVLRRELVAGLARQRAGDPGDPSGTREAGMPGSGVAGAGMPGAGRSGVAALGPGVPGERRPGTGTSGAGMSGAGAPGRGTPSTVTPGAGRPGPGTAGAGTLGPGVPGVGTAGPGASGTGSPGAETPGTEVLGTEAPGTDASGTEAPGNNPPGTDPPGTDTPAPSSPPGRPDARPGTVGAGGRGPDCEGSDTP
ncbi:AMP-binding protein [Streptomyces sp. NPDC056716]|uniref:class I adenylate-forming enzyme family protein n=1 Tax=unclassified Streptomyces TaxID=2593676 RepID=UPI0036AFECAE